ncbi:hypothetical protein K440DRAFT_644523 [Wilcoxina mikolae CBS 423.85]|nr:hypothetical protein K440DRAFT_644523 [Wilcoxina mikolae CBS 423.85]
MSSPPTTPLVPVRNNTMTYRVAFQARNGCAKLYEFELMELDPGSEIMRKLRAKAKEIMFPSRLFGLVWKVVIETAIIEPINGTDLERQTPLEINLRENKPNPWLTQAFHKPETLGRAPDFTEFKIEGEGMISAPMKTLVIRTGINKSVVMFLLLFTATFACVIGIVVGMLTRKAELGFGVACVVFALISVVQGLVVGYMRELGGGGR